MFFVDGGAVMVVVVWLITSGCISCCANVGVSERLFDSTVFTSIGFVSSTRGFTSSFFSKDNFVSLIVSTGGRSGDFSFVSTNRDGW